MSFPPLILSPKEEKLPRPVFVVAQRHVGRRAASDIDSPLEEQPLIVWPDILLVQEKVVYLNEL